jgi:hypothetical protein
MIGHSSEKMTDLYSHIDTDHKKEAIDELKKRIKRDPSGGSSGGSVHELKAAYEKRSLKVQ